MGASAYYGHISISFFSKQYRLVYRHYGLVSKFKVGLKLLLQQGLSEPEFYGDSMVNIE